MAKQQLIVGGFITAFLLIFATLAHAIQTGSYSVIYAPKYVKFLENANTLDANEIPSVVSASLGLPLVQDLKWNGLAEGSLFHRPKASVVVSINSAANNPFKVKQFQHSYVTHETDGALDTDRIIRNIGRENWKQEPFNVDFYVESAVPTLRTSAPSELFAQLPSTLYRLRDGLNTDWFTADRLDSLNLTQDADLDLIGELYSTLQIINALKENGQVLKAHAPDFFHFTISGLMSIDARYGRHSTQAHDAVLLLNKFIDKLTTELRALYADRVVVQVVTYSTTPDLAVLSRKARSLLETSEVSNSSTPGDLNLAPNYTSMYAPMFNIILWFMIVFALAIFGISWGIWHMDPGRDSVIYRMTSQRMKRD
jgi:renin receptor